MRAFRILLLILVVLMAVPYVLAPFYRAGHPVSALMALRRLEGHPVIRQWVDLPAMSPHLPAAVVGAEDAHFCKHHGIDFGALREVINTAEEGGEVRGASTITQQVAKNLFLAWLPDVIRKVFEFPLALWIDFVLPKQRILEIYLNIAALGPSGQFGAEAGSEYAFGHSATMLTAREAALLASILPNPSKRSAKTPSPGVRRLAAVHMVRAGDVRRCWAENR